MDASVREEYDLGRDFGQKSFRAGCYAPFTSLNFTPIGDVQVCCKNWSYILGNVTRSRLAEIWRSPEISKLRQSMLAYQFDKGCELCEWQIANGDPRGTQAFNYDRYPVESTEPQWPQEMGFALSNTCNYECIMCSGDLSSSIRARREGLPPLPQAYSDTFFDDLREFLPHLKHAIFYGGEPFITQECFRVFDMMLEMGITIPCHVTTNASRFDARVERILEAIPFSMSLSVDGVTRETVEKVRVNCNFDDYSRNIVRFREHARTRGRHVNISTCLMRQNWHEFGAVLLLAENLDCPVFVNTVLSPPHCSLYTLPPSELSRIVAEMEAQSPEIERKLVRNGQIWRDQLRNLRNSAEAQGGGLLTQIRHAALEPEINEQSAQYFVSKGWSLSKAGRLSEALEEALKIPKGDPHYYEALCLRGHIRLLMGDLAASETDLSEAVQLSRRPYAALITRAWLRCEEKRYQEGLEDARRAAELCRADPHYEGEACWVLGELYWRSGDFAEAGAALDRLLELRPGQASVRVARAQMFDAAGSRQQAFREIDAALLMEPNLADALQFQSELLSR